MNLKNTVGIVTGASQGLGKAFAEALLKKGAKVVISDINHVQGAITKAEFDQKYGPSQTTFTSCDVTSQSQLKDLFSKTLQKFGKLDILCNNAGINNENSWEKTISVNLVALIQANYLALEHMRRDHGGKGGSIVNVASMSTTETKRKQLIGKFQPSAFGLVDNIPAFQPYPINPTKTSGLAEGFLPAAHAPVYTASKHGVLGFTRSLAEASILGNYGIRINALCPGFVNTTILDTINHEETLGMFYQFKDTVKHLMDVFGILEPSIIADGFIQLVEDNSLNGAAMKITKSKGIHFENY